MDISSTPTTPSVIEKISRLIAAHDCLVFLGQMRGEKSSGSELRDIAERMLDRLYGDADRKPSAMLDPAEYDYSTTPPAETARTLDKSRPGSLYHKNLSRRDYPSDDIEDL